VAVRLRLTRVGSRKNPVWRVVAADGRSPRDGRVLEIVGRYNPQPQPSEIVLDRERIDHWLARGAQPSDTVRKLIRAVERGTPPAAAVAAPKPSATATAEPAGDAGDEASAAAAEPEPAEAVGSDDDAESDDTASTSADAVPADDGEGAGEGEG